MRGILLSFVLLPCLFSLSVSQDGQKYCMWEDSTNYLDMNYLSYKGPNTTNFDFSVTWKKFITDIYDFRFQPCQRLVLRNQDCIGDTSLCQVSIGESNKGGGYILATIENNTIKKISQDLYLYESSGVTESDQLTRRTAITIRCDHNQTTPVFFHTGDVETEDTHYNLNFTWNCLTLNSLSFLPGIQNSITIRGNHLDGALLQIQNEPCNIVENTSTSVTCHYTPIGTENLSLNLTTIQYGKQYSNSFTLMNYGTDLNIILSSENFTTFFDNNQTIYREGTTFRFLSGNYTVSPIRIINIDQVTFEVDEGADFHSLNEQAIIQIESSGTVHLKRFQFRNSDSPLLFIKSRTLVVENSSLDVTNDSFVSSIQFLNSEGSIDMSTSGSESLYVYNSSIENLVLSSLVKAIFNLTQFNKEVKTSAFNVQSMDSIWGASFIFDCSVQTTRNLFLGKAPRINSTIWDSNMDVFESLEFPILATGNSKITLTSAKFNSGEASMQISGGRIKIQGSTFINVRRFTINATSSIVDIENSTFSSCNSPLYLVSSPLTLDTSVFQRNTAQNGGGIYLFGASSSIKNSLFDSNVASDQGGALRVSNIDELRLENCIFTGNSGRKGGGIYVGEKSPVYIKNSTLERNVAVYGGGIHYDTSARFLQRQFFDFVSLNILESTFIGNSGTSAGGALHSFNPNGGSISIISSVFKENISPSGNGFTLDGKVDLISSNLVGENTVAIYVTTNSTLNATQSEFGNNRIFLLSSSISFTIYGASSNIIQCSDGLQPKDSNGTIVCIPITPITQPAIIANDSTFPTGIVVGVVVGGVVLLILLILIVVFVLWRRKSNKIKKQGGGELEMNQMRSSTMLQNVKVGQIIGSGNFGEVFLGSWDDSAVALKSLTVEAEGTDVEKQWKEEIRLLSALNHPNVVRLWGLYEQGGKVFMVMEFAQKGSLYSYLRNSRDSNNSNYTNVANSVLSEKPQSPKEDSGAVLSEEDLARMCFETARGMKYLSQKGIIHRDLASRNLLLDSQLHVKISDFGMSRENSVYSTKEKTLPYRWCAPEVILEGISTTQSDVWSFGVVVWEIFSKAALPYADLTNEQIRLGFKSKTPNRLEKPDRCPPKLWGLVERCFQWNPQDRPDFNEICEVIPQQFPSISSQVVYERESKVDEGTYLTNQKGPNDSPGDSGFYSPK
eukprot:TRINITY_DN7768_c0_g1_i1.p1 TRINITY_DN7768_c0_g1~~TRINITY_DN7768_c0_g1_i1.p1  ORF type:complete len:1193 (+),score=287.92 TRINITY_DN7768_c0_g1_i1:35-3580(+)